MTSRDGLFPLVADTARVDYPWKRLVVWGPGADQDSLRWPFLTYAQTARKLGLSSEVVLDRPESRAMLRPGDLVLCANVWQRHLGEAVDGVQYVTHNIEGSHPLIRTVAPENHIALQVWTDECQQYEGEQWGDVCRWHGPGRTLFRPWGTDMLAEELEEPIHNPSATDCFFIGAVWDDNGLGNAAVIEHVRKALERRRLRFRHLTQVSPRSMVDAVRRSRIAPAFAGEWQVAKGYVPERCVKNPSYGALCVTNVPRVRALFGDAHVGGESVEELLDGALRLSSRDYVAMVREQQRCVVRHGLTYRHSLEAIARAFGAIRN